jgi:hypothetical protein
VLLALIAGTVSYLHMHPLVALHGPLGASGSRAVIGGRDDRGRLDTLLADSRAGELPWALLVTDSPACLTGNVAVGQPT